MLCNSCQLAATRFHSVFTHFKKKLLFFRERFCPLLLNYYYEIIVELSDKTFKDVRARAVCLVVRQLYSTRRTALLTRVAQGEACGAAQCSGAHANRRAANVYLIPPSFKLEDKLLLYVTVSYSARTMHTVHWLSYLPLPYNTLHWGGG